MAEHVFDVDAFRAQFPAYSDKTKYPDDTLSGYFVEASCYVNPYDRCLISGNCLQLALNLMVAHLCFINDAIAAGQGTSGVQTGATVGQVSVQLAPPPIKNGFQQWLAQSPYGLRLWGLLRVKGAGGMYLGGSPERAGFRKIGGQFPPYGSVN